MELDSNRASTLARPKKVKRTGSGNLPCDGSASACLLGRLPNSGLFARLCSHCLPCSLAYFLLLRSLFFSVLARLVSLGVFSPLCSDLFILWASSFCSPPIRFPIDLHLGRRRFPLFPFDLYSLFEKHLHRLASIFIFIFKDTLLQHANF